MSQHHLPAGCHDAETAAQLLNMSKRALLKKMRELGWLNVSGGKENRNLPRREFTNNGYLCTQDRGYCLRGKKEISKTYRVMLLTQTGFIALKNELQKMEQQTKAVKEQSTAVVAHLPKPHQMNQVAQQEPEAPYDRAAADKERQETLRQMQEWFKAS